MSLGLLEQGGATTSVCFDQACFFLTRFGHPLANAPGKDGATPIGDEGYGVQGRKVAHIRRSRATKTNYKNLPCDFSRLRAFSVCVELSGPGRLAPKIFRVIYHGRALSPSMLRLPASSASQEKYSSLRDARGRKASHKRRNRATTINYTENLCYEAPGAGKPHTNKRTVHPREITRKISAARRRGPKHYTQTKKTRNREKSHGKSLLRGAASQNTAYRRKKRATLRNHTESLCCETPRARKHHTQGGTA